MVAPAVQWDALRLSEGHGERLIAVGSPEWYQWLSEAERFSYASPRGAFVAYKEPRDRGGSYWRACRRRGGKLERVYLGRDEHLSLERLEETAGAFSESKADHLMGPKCGPTAACEPCQKGDVAANAFAPLQEVSQEKSLLRAKLSAQPGRSADVPRPRLIQRMNEALRHKLTVVLAPAGYGKTTLLGQWARAREDRIAWLTLDAGDSNAARFWAYFVSALASRYPDIGKPLLRQLRSGAPPDESFLIRLTNAFTAVDDLVLVLDDYHVVQNLAISEGLAFLLTHLPPQVHLVISSRTEPPMPLVRLRATGELLEVKATNLCFTPDEAASFLNEGMQLGLTENETSMLQGRTEGWVAGLQLAGLWMQGSDDVHRLAAAFSGAHRHVVDYLVGEVLDKQVEAVREFLLRTSILERLNGQLCEAVCQLASGDGQRMLQYLERANLFTAALDSERRWYRYHHLFAGCLSTNLSEREPALAPELHRRASEWHATNGLITEAVKHALAANDAELAARLIEEAGARLIKRGDVVTVLTLLAALPEETVRGQPWLCILEVIALLTSGRIDGAEARLRHLERYVSSVVTSTDGPGTVDRAHKDVIGIRAVVTCLRAALASGHGDTEHSTALWLAGNQATHHGSEAVSLIAERARLGLVYNCLLFGDWTSASQLLTEAKHANQAGGSPYENVVTLRLIADAQIDRGQLHAAEQTLRQALRVAADDGAATMALANVFASLALVNYERNELEDAKAHASEAEKAASKGPFIRRSLGAYRVMCLTKLAEHDVAAAVDFLDRAEELGRDKIPPAELAWVSDYRVRLWLQQGNVRAARRWIETAGIETDGRLSERVEAEQRALARVLIAERRAGDALLVLNRLAGTAESAGRFGSLVETLVLCAIAERDMGEIDAALRTLDRALLLAEPEGYARTFIDGGATVGVLLTQMLEISSRRQRSRTERATVTDYILRLLPAFEREDRAAAYRTACEARCSGSVPTLSEREREVLRLIANGSSRLRVARTLVVSRHTVDSHMQAIYAKLDAHNRVVALSRARELGLL